MWIVGLPPHSRWLAHESFSPHGGRAVDGSKHITGLSRMLSEFLIKNSGKPPSALSILLCAVRGCSHGRAAEAKRVPGRRVRPRNRRLGGEKATRSLECGGSTRSEPNPAMVADWRRDIIGIPQCGERPENQTLNPSIRTGYL